MVTFLDMESFADRIDAIPGPSGWWKHDTGVHFREAGNVLVARGMSEDEAVVFLDVLYHAVAEEYGN